MYWSVNVIRQIINIGENFQNSVVAKGSHINQSFDSSTNSLTKNPIKNVESETSESGKGKKGNF